MSTRTYLFLLWTLSGSVVFLLFVTLSPRPSTCILSCCCTTSVCAVCSKAGGILWWSDSLGLKLHRGLHLLFHTSPKSFPITTHTQWVLTWHTGVTQLWDMCAGGEGLNKPWVFVYCVKGKWKSWYFYLLPDVGLIVCQLTWCRMSHCVDYIVGRSCQ